MNKQEFGLRCLGIAAICNSKGISFEININKNINYTHISIFDITPSQDKKEESNEYISSYISWENCEEILNKMLISINKYDVEK